MPASTPSANCCCPNWPPFGSCTPDVRLELISESRFIDIVEERFDAGIRLGGEVDESMVAVPITRDMEMAVVATPDAARYGFPASRGWWPRTPVLPIR